MQFAGGMDGLEARLLRAIGKSQAPLESDAFAESAGVEHAAVVGLMKSLLTCDMIAAEVSLPTPAPVSRPLFWVKARESGACALHIQLD